MIKTFCKRMAAPMLACLLVITLAIPTAAADVGAGGQPCEAMIGSTEYATLQLAMQEAKQGDVVSLAQDVTLSQDLTVPAGVILLIPCVDNDPGYCDDGAEALMLNHDGSDADSQAQLYRTLTVARDVTLTVEGRVLVNSVSGRPVAAGGDQDITGGYGEIALEGSLVVQNGGVLDCFGYIRGDGRVTVREGGTVGELFLIRNWRGSVQSLLMCQESVFPMNEYDCNNIRAALRMESGATLEGLVKLYANDVYYYTRFSQVNDHAGLLRLNQDAYLIRTTQDIDGMLRTVFEIHGGAEFAGSHLDLFGMELDTTEFCYPIDGDLDYRLYDGQYDVTCAYKAMPGATVTVGADAVLRVEKDAELVLYRRFDDKENLIGSVNTAYPADRSAAKLILEDNGSLINAGTFAGEIETENHDIYIDASANWQATTKEANGFLATPATCELEHGLNITHREGDISKIAEDNTIIWNGQADYSKVRQAMAAIPEDTRKYTAASVAAIQEAVDAVVWELDESRQAEVEAMAQAILDAIRGLELNQVTVTFDPNGGQGGGQISADVGAALTKPAEPKRTGYTFTGWYQDAACTTAATMPDVMPDENCTYYAGWQVNLYMITFESAGGTAVDSITVEYGATIVLPEAPARKAYIFLGWEGYTEGMAMPAEDLIFTAQWAVGINKITSEVFQITDGESIGKISVGTMVQGLLQGLAEQEYCAVYDQQGEPVASDTLVGTGMTVTLQVDGQEQETLVVIVTGDVNGDGRITVSDMIQVKAHLLESKPLEGVYAIAADVDGNGNLTISDFIQSKAHILGKGSITAR